MLIRVKERGLNKKNRKNREREKNDRERGETKRKTKLWGICLLDDESSVEVGYGFYAIRSKLLIANDMCWVVL